MRPRARCTSVLSLYETPSGAPHGITSYTQPGAEAKRTRSEEYRVETRSIEGTDEERKSEDEKTTEKKTGRVYGIARWRVEEKSTLKS